MSTPQGRKVIKDGKAYYKISDAAKILGTNAVKVRQLMGRGELDWIQLRPGSKTLLVSADSLIRVKYPETLIVRVREHGNSR